MHNTKTANPMLEERREKSVKKKIANAMMSAKGLLYGNSGDQMTGWLIVVLVVVVVGAIFLTLYQGSVTTIWNSIVSKITNLLN